MPMGLQDMSAIYLSQAHVSHDLIRNDEYFCAKSNGRMGLAQQWAVKAVACYVVFGWLLMEILYFGVWCQPFSQYWAVPVDNSKSCYI